METSTILNLNRVLDIQTYAFSFEKKLIEYSNAVLVSPDILSEVTTRFLFKEKYRKIQSAKFPFFNRKMKVARYIFRFFKKDFFREKGFLIEGVTNLVNRVVPLLISFRSDRNEIFFESGDKRDFMFEFFDVMKVYKFGIRFKFPWYKDICENNRQRIRFFRDMVLRKLVKPIGLRRRMFPYLFLLHMGFRSRLSWSQGNIFFITNFYTVKSDQILYRIYKYNKNYNWLLFQRAVNIFPVESY